MNLLTFDTEEWYLEQQYFGAKETKFAEYDRLLEEVLYKLSEVSLKGTFFCVGKLATEFPYVVRKISDAGHEVGCHSLTHQWLNKMTYEQVMEDTHAAVDSLQQCIGKKILSYRAPAFSIGNNNKWVFEVLVNNGICCDASIFPASRDFGGFPEFGKNEPSIVRYSGMEIHEFPVSTTRVFGNNIAYSGGGYFRFFPYRFIEKTIQEKQYSMTYFHLGDLVPVISGVMTKEEYERYFHEPGTVKARYFRYMKTNMGTGKNKKRLFKLLDRVNFCNILNADQHIDWSKAPVLTLI